MKINNREYKLRFNIGVSIEVKRETGQDVNKILWSKLAKEMTRLNVLNSSSEQNEATQQALGMDMLGLFYDTFEPEVIVSLIKHMMIAYDKDLKKEIETIDFYNINFSGADIVEVINHLMPHDERSTDEGKEGNEKQKQETT